MEFPASFLYLEKIEAVVALYQLAIACRLRTEY
jgi:hypothetical protein